MKTNPIAQTNQPRTISQFNNENKTQKLLRMINEEMIKISNPSIKEVIQDLHKKSSDSFMKDYKNKPRDINLHAKYPLDLFNFALLRGKCICQAVIREKCETAIEKYPVYEEEIIEIYNRASYISLVCRLNMLTKININEDIVSPCLDILDFAEFRTNTCDLGAPDPLQEFTHGLNTY